MVLYMGMYIDGYNYTSQFKHSNRWIMALSCNFNLYLIMTNYVEHISTSLLTIHLSTLVEYLFTSLFT